MRSHSLKELYERHADELRHYLRRLTRGRGQDAEDIAQNAFLRLAALPVGEAVDNPRALLYATARNLMVDELRRRSHAESFYSIAAGRDTGRDDRSPENIALDGERLHIVEKVILSLPPKRRHVFILSRVQQLGYREIARETGLTVAGVKQHIIRALADCRRALAEQYQDRPPP